MRGAIRRRSCFDLALSKAEGKSCYRSPERVAILAAARQTLEDLRSLSPLGENRESVSSDILTSCGSAEAGVE